MRSPYNELHNKQRDADDDDVTNHYEHVSSSRQHIEHESSESFSIHRRGIGCSRSAGEGVSESVVQVMKTMTEYPELLGDLSLFSLECMNYSAHRESPSSPASPTLRGASSYLSALTVASDATAVAPYVLSDWERTTYYNGISPDPPELLYRSDLLENPFPIPEGRHPHLPTKTVHGVFNTPLNAVWDTVAPQICKLLKARNIRYSAIKAARFITHGEDGKDTRGPIVIWIATHPTTTTAKNAHDASPDILALLKANGIEGPVIEWYEGAVRRL